MGSRLRRILVVVAVALALSPLLSLAAVLACKQGWVLTDDLDAGSLWEPGRLLVSVVAALGAGAIAVVLGWVLCGLASWRPLRLRWVAGGFKACVLAGALVPLALPVVLLGGIMAHLGGVGPAPAPLAASFETLAAWCWLCLAWGVAYAPLTMLVLVAALADVPEAEFRSARSMLGRVPLRLVWLWLWRPAMLAWLCVALFVMLDAATPAHFGVRTFASGIAEHFLATLDLRGSVMASAPLWLAGAFVLGYVANGMHAPRAWRSRRCVYQPGPLHIVGGVLLGLVLLALCVIWPLEQSQGFQASTPTTATALAENIDELVMSLGAGMAGGIAAALCGGLVMLWSESGGTSRWLIVALLLAPLATPGLAMGFAAKGVDVASGYGMSQMIWWLALLLRCAPWALLVIGSIWHRSRAAQAYELYGVGTLRRMRVNLSEGGTLVLGCLFLVGWAGAMREVDLFAGYTLAGYDTLSARSAQLLHYGMLPRVYDLMAIQGLLALVWAGCVLGVAWVLARERTC